MGVLVKENKYFKLGLEWNEQETAGILFYFPKQFIDTSKPFDELTEMESKYIGQKYIQGNTLEELKEQFEQAEYELQLINEGMEYVLAKKAQSA